MLVTRAGLILGRLPAILVETPWWQEASPIVRAARTAFDLDIVVLRLLESELGRPQGGAVTYLAEAREPLPAPALAALAPWDGTLDDQPLRLRWAQPGGPAADLDWAEDVLRERHLERVGPARQVRTWNLSSIWELPLRDGAAWLKVVPPFFAHEGDVLRRLGGGPVRVPRLLGHDHERILLADVAGEDCYDAARPEQLTMVSMLVDLQAAWMDRTPELLALGLPDWRAPALTAELVALIARRGPELTHDHQASLARFLGGLGDRFEMVRGCGLPDTLVHGDFHRGNVRGQGNVRGRGSGLGTPAELTLLDWGDCGVGHPLLDMAAFLDRIPPDDAAAVRTHWFATWRRLVPNADPERAAALLVPVAAARQALIYQVFVDGIEPVERRYHDADVVEWLARTAEAAADPGAG